MYLYNNEHLLYIYFTRLATVVLVVVGVLWLPVIQAYGSGELFVYMQSILSYLSPAVLAVFTGAVAWKRINETVCNTIRQGFKGTFISAIY